jgi:transcriptional regulator
MYLPAHFAESRPEVLHELVRAHPFGLLVTQDGSGELSANGVPFMLDADPAGGPGILRAHVARANPLWREASAGRDSLVVFQGPQAYVSPAWYPGKAEHGKVVPTWNYVMVQARGRLRAIEDAAWLRAFVGRLTDRHEAPRAAPWGVDDAPADYVQSILRAIVGLEIVLTSLTGKWKVTQNRPAADREGVARGLLDEAGGDEASALARQVRAPGSPD